MTTALSITKDFSLARETYSLVFSKPSISYQREGDRLLTKHSWAAEVGDNGC